MFELKLKTSCLGFSVLILGGCIDLHDIYLHDRRISQEEITTLKMSPEIQAIHYAPNKHVVFYYPKNPCWRRCTAAEYAEGHCCTDTHLFDFDDPVSLVQHHFVTAVRTALEMDNIRSISDAQPRSEDQHGALQQSFGNGLILTFDTRIWHLDMDKTYALNSYLVPDPSDFSGIYWFDYAVRGTLIRLEDSKILWRGTCRGGLPFKTDTGPLPSRLEIDVNSTLLKTARALIAKDCGEELVKRFLGKRITVLDMLGFAP